MKGGRDVPINNYGLLSEESRSLRAVSGSFLLNGDNQSNDMTPSGSRDPKNVSFFFPTSEDLVGYERLYSSPSVNVRTPSCTSSLKTKPCLSLCPTTCGIGSSWNHPLSRSRRVDYTEVESANP